MMRAQAKASRLPAVYAKFIRHQPPRKHGHDMPLARRRVRGWPICRVSALRRQAPSIALYATDFMRWAMSASMAIMAKMMIAGNIAEARHAQFYYGAISHGRLFAISKAPN